MTNTALRDAVMRVLPRVKNFNVAVIEEAGKVIFLHRIVPGGVDKSYGIQVARLAGVPKEVLERAKVILRNLEDSELTPAGLKRTMEELRTTFLPVLNKIDLSKE